MTPANRFNAKAQCRKNPLAWHLGGLRLGAKLSGLGWRLHLWDEADLWLFFGTREFGSRPRFVGGEPDAGDMSIHYRHPSASVGAQVNLR
jgi:hypothetical protein